MSRKVKRLYWVKDPDGWYGQPPIYFSISKTKKQAWLTVVELWKKPGSQVRHFPASSIAAAKQMAAYMWKNLV